MIRVLESIFSSLIVFSESESGGAGVRFPCVDLKLLCARFSEKSDYCIRSIVRANAIAASYSAIAWFWEARFVDFFPPFSCHRNT